MIRRCGISLLFAILGIASLLFLSVIDARLCDSFPKIQYCSDRFHGCGLDCSQSWPLSEKIKAFFFFFGPSIVFAGTAFFFSKQPRRAFAWCVLLVVLVVVHSVVMLAGKLVG